MKIDLEKVKQYVKPRFKLNTKVEGKSKFFRFDFKKCTEEDFHTHNFYPKTDELEVFLQRLCPDFGDFDTKLLIKNGYSNKTRTSFSIEIEKCGDIN